MTLHNTAKEANYKDSIKKFFVDNLETIENIQVSMDTSLAAPLLQGSAVSKWVTLDFGPMYKSELSLATLTLYCCTRDDPEGRKLDRLVDTVMNYITNSDDDMGTRRIELFDSDTWTQVGALVISNFRQGALAKAPDETKYLPIHCEIRWASKL